ncbi:RICIN domain-containing protein [Kineosporia succinea]|uniref:Ricin B lectin domain-containing protein n=1 Tax=Kineosporia succinea TaxID=84632 RepID=A0ABT9PEP9_9ACTN|nr:RICIN domain-containing protein [Kineosporia succinea]MDP9830957.1 hypothetical protein [Kineosporia succinea]
MKPTDVSPDPRAQDDDGRDEAQVPAVDDDLATVLLQVTERDEETGTEGEQGDTFAQETWPAPDRDEQQAAFLASSNTGRLGRIPALSFPTRGVKGVAVMAGSLVAVAALVFGGVKGVQAIAGSFGDEEKPAATVAAVAPTGSPSPTPTGVRPTRERAASGTPSRADDPAVADPAAQPAGGGAKARPEETAGTGPTAGDDAPVTGGTKATDASSSSKASTTAAATIVTTSVGVLRNRVTGLCADLDGTGTVAENVLVRQRACAPGSGDNQEYQTVKDPDGSFLLRNVKSQWCLDVNGSGTVSSGISVNTHNCLFGTRDNQMFRAQAQGSGFYLVHVKSGLCLNVANPDGSNQVAGLKLTLYPCHPDDDHVWSFG